MTTRPFHVAAVLLATALAIACTGGSSQTDQRLKDMEQKLADTQKQLADAEARKNGDAAAQAQATETAAAERGAAADTNANLQKQVDSLKPRQITIPAGTTIQVRTTSELSTDKVSDGSTFDAVLEKDLKSGDAVVAKAGSRVHGVVVTSDKGGRVKGTASLILGLKSIVTVRGTTLAVQTDTTSSEAASTKKKDAVRTGVATGVGAVVGGIVGGGKGAAIGAGTGAAVGVGTNAATRGAAAKVEAESLLEFHLAAPVTFTYTPAPQG